MAYKYTTGERQISGGSQIFGDDSPMHLSAAFTASDVIFNDHVTASSGLTLGTTSDLVAYKTNLTADGNEGASGDAVMIFDASASDVAKSITVAQLMTAGGAVATSANSTFSGNNTFSGKLTASNGLHVSGDMVQLGLNIPLIFDTDGDSYIVADADDQIEIACAQTAVVTFTQDNTEFANEVTASNGFTIEGLPGLVNAAVKLQFRDTGIYLHSSTDGQLDIVADTTVAIAGAATFDGNVTLGDAAGDVITATGKLSASNGINVTGDATLANVSFSGLAGNYTASVGGGSGDAFAVDSENHLIGVTTSGGAIQVTMPKAADVGSGKIYTIKDISGVAATNKITVSGTTAGNGADDPLFDGAASLTISSNYGAINLFTDGTHWYIF